MAASKSYKWKELWVGIGPPSPSGAPPGLTISYTREAWKGVIGEFGPTHESKAELPVDWSKSVLLFVQCGENGVGVEPHLKALSRASDTVMIAVELRLPESGPSPLAVVVRPWLIAEAPKAAFDGNPRVRFTIGGDDCPVVEKR
jgi:hypothetical protein